MPLRNRGSTSSCMFSCLRTSLLSTELFAHCSPDTLAYLMMSNVKKQTPSHLQAFALVTTAIWTAVFPNLCITASFPLLRSQLQCHLLGESFLTRLFKATVMITLFYHLHDYSENLFLFCCVSCAPDSTEQVSFITVSPGSRTAHSTCSTNRCLLSVKFESHVHLCPCVYV